MKQSKFNAGDRIYTPYVIHLITITTAIALWKKITDIWKKLPNG